MKNVAVILTAAVIAGCAGTVDPQDAEEAQYRMQDEHIKALERYEQLQRTCARNGGIVFVSRRNGGRLAPPLTAGEMKGASCSPAVLF